MSEDIDRDKIIEGMEALRKVFAVTVGALNLGELVLNTYGGKAEPRYNEMKELHLQALTALSDVERLSDADLIIRYVQVEALVLQMEKLAERNALTKQ